MQAHEAMAIPAGSSGMSSLLDGPVLGKIGEVFVTILGSVISYRLLKSS